MYNNKRSLYNNWYTQGKAGIDSNNVRSFVANMVGTLMDDYIRIKYKIDNGKVIFKVSEHNMPNYTIEQMSSNKCQIVKDGKNYKIVMYLDTISNSNSINCHLNAIVEIIRLFATCVNLVIEVEEPLVMLAMRKGNNEKDYYKDIIRDRLGETVLIYNKKD